MRHKTEGNVMLRSIIPLLALQFAAHAAFAAEVGSNANPLSFGKDQTIVDIGKVVWGPLDVEGLPKGGEIAVLRGDLAKGDAEVLLRFPPGYKVPNHSHTSDEVYMWAERRVHARLSRRQAHRVRRPRVYQFSGQCPSAWARVWHGCAVRGVPRVLAPVRHSVLSGAVT